VLCNALSHVKLPINALLYKERDCQRHNAQLELYYTDIVKCLQATAAGLQKFWWTLDLDELKEQCIDISTLRVSIGRPRSGSINEERLHSKYRYKQAIKMAIMTVCMTSYTKRTMLVFGKLGISGSVLIG